MDVNFIQKSNSIEPYFWTNEQIENYKSKLHSEKDKLFSIGDVNYKWKFISNEKLSNFDFEFESGINVVVIHEEYNLEYFQDFVNKLFELKNSDKFVYLVFTKLVEDYWAWNQIREDENFLKELSKIGNLKIIWDVAFYKLDNFIFSPKVQIQSYFLNNKFGGDAYYWGRDIFINYPKEYRIGLHINKIQNNVRYNLVKTFHEYKNPNLFFTVNSNCLYNEGTPFGDLTRFGNYKSPVFLKEIQQYRSIGVFNNWYTAQFIEHGLKSEMEIVYETFTYTDIPDSNTWLIKLNEKTIKHLFLGKPFIHTDPIAHKLMYENEMLPYRPLYSDELWDMYENWDINIRKGTPFIEKIKENVDWLCNMEQLEWNNRINESLKIAKINKNKVDDLIFNTSLIDIIKSNSF